MTKELSTTCTTRKQESLQLGFNHGIFKKSSTDILASALHFILHIWRTILTSSGVTALSLSLSPITSLTAVLTAHPKSTVSRDPPRPQILLGGAFRSD